MPQNRPANLPPQHNPLPQPERLLLQPFLYVTYSLKLNESQHCSFSIHKHDTPDVYI